MRLEIGRWGILPMLLVLCAVSAGGCANSSADGFGQTLATPGSSGPAMAAAGVHARPLHPASAHPGQLAANASALTTSATPGASGYKIGPQDVLEISVFKVPELSKSVQVAEGGTINLPLVGEVEATGRTSRDLERDLTDRLGDRYLKNPQVTVFVREFNSQRITVEGAVKKPGVFPYRGRATLLQAIALAEGPNPTADTDAIVVRMQNGQRSAAKFDLAAIRKGQSPDPPVYSGDVVILGESAAKETFSSLIKLIPLAGIFALL